MKNSKRIAVETNAGVRYFSVPADELNESTCTNANQRGAGVCVTSTYYSPRGRVIERIYSCWDNGRGECTGECLACAGNVGGDWPRQPKPNNSKPMKLNQIAANQTEIEQDNGRTVFFSYSTPVAIFEPGKGALCTSKKHSVTTSKHINQAVARWGATRTNVEQAEIDRLAA